VSLSTAHPSRMSSMTFIDLVTCLHDDYGMDIDLTPGTRDLAPVFASATSRAGLSWMPTAPGLGALPTCGAPPHPRLCVVAADASHFNAHEAGVLVGKRSSFERARQLLAEATEAL
jgi:hypothetical protein